VIVIFVPVLFVHRLYIQYDQQKGRELTMKKYINNINNINYIILITYLKIQNLKALVLLDTKFVFL
jgi:hypothetical protein